MGCSNLRPHSHKIPHLLNPANLRDRFDAQHILKLMLEGTFPRIWVPTPENRDIRQLVLHRHRRVGMRTRVMNQRQAIAMNEGIRRSVDCGRKRGRA